MIENPIFWLFLFLMTGWLCGLDIEKVNHQSKAEKIATVFLVFYGLIFFVTCFRSLQQ